MGVKKIFVGHTEVEDISSDYDGGLVRVNINQPSQKNSMEAQALLIEGDEFYRVNGEGERVIIIN